MLYRQSLQQFIDRWRYNANRGIYLLIPVNKLTNVLCVAPQAQARIKVLEKLPVLEPPEVEDTESFR